MNPSPDFRAIDERFYLQVIDFREVIDLIRRHWSVNLRTHQINLYLKKGSEEKKILK